MQQVKSENNNLVARLGQSDGKTASFKALLQTLGEQLRKVEKENKDLKIAFQVTVSFRYFIHWVVTGLEIIKIFLCQSKYFQSGDR